MTSSISVNPPFLEIDPTKYTSDIINVRSMSDTSLLMSSTTLAYLGLFLFDSLQSGDL